MSTFNIFSSLFITFYPKKIPTAQLFEILVEGICYLHKIEIKLSVLLFGV